MRLTYSRCNTVCTWSFCGSWHIVSPSGISSSTRFDSSNVGNATFIIRPGATTCHASIERHQIETVSCIISKHTHTHVHSSQRHVCAVVMGTRNVLPALERWIRCWALWVEKVKAVHVMKMLSSHPDTNPWPAVHTLFTQTQTECNVHTRPKLPEIRNNEIIPGLLCCRAVFVVFYI